MTNRLKPHVRRELVLRAAVEAARAPGGWSALTRARIAGAAGCSEGLVSRYLGDMGSARAAIMRVAVRDEIVEIVVQSMVRYDGYRVPRKLKQKALLSLITQ